MMREMSGAYVLSVHREQQDKLYKTLCGEKMIIINKPINIPTQRTIAFPSTHTHTHTLMLNPSYSVSPGAGQRERTHGKPFLASVQYASRWIGWNLLHFNGHYTAVLQRSLVRLSGRANARWALYIVVVDVDAVCFVVVLTWRTVRTHRMFVESCAVDVHLRIFSL